MKKEFIAQKKYFILLMFFSIFITSCVNHDDKLTECEQGYMGETCTECVEGYVSQSKYCIYDCSNIENVDKVNTTNDGCICNENYVFDKVDKTCNEINSCNSDRDCDLGYICNETQCVDGCRDNNECDDNEICNIENKCEINSDYCADSTTCPTNYECRAHHCELIVGTECVFDEDCSDGNACMDGFCIVKPVAKCNPNYIEVEPAIDNPSNPISVITLNGSESFDPNGDILTYHWERISAPTGSTAMPRTPTQETSKYFVDLAGEHKLRLTVTNTSGLSDSCEVTAVGITSNALHIELFWNQEGDLDLHLKKFGTNDTAWGTNNDCFWGNTCKGVGLEWGEPGAIDNPKLDRDDITARGPENINMDTPEITPIDQYYTVGVKNYSNASSPTATVRIYCNGGAQYEYSMGLPQAGTSFWMVAGIEWTGNGCNINPINSVGSYPGATGTK